MPSNNSNNNVKHKIGGYYVSFSKTTNKWQVKDGNKFITEGNFAYCKKYCKTNKLTNK